MKLKSVALGLSFVLGLCNFIGSLLAIWHYQIIGNEFYGGSFDVGSKQKTANGGN